MNHLSPLSPGSDKTGHGEQKATSLLVGLKSTPRNEEAEMGLLGGIFIDNRVLESVSDFLRPEHFAWPIHQRIFADILLLSERGQIVNPVTLKNIYENTDVLEAVDGAGYLARLVDYGVTAAEAGEYGRLVFDLFLKRQLIEISDGASHAAYTATADDPAESLIEAAEQSLFELGANGGTGGGCEPFSSSILKALKAAEAAHNRDGGLAGVSTGLTDVDKLLGGLHRADLIILAGRPSMGKTALATNIAYNAAESYLRREGDAGAVVGFFSLEMSAEQLASRILAEQADIVSARMRRGELSNVEFDRLVEVSTKLNTMPFFIDDTPALSIAALRTRARRMKRKHGLGLVVVDYLQLMTPPRSRRDNRVQEVSDISGGLKAIAKDLDVPVLALSQLSRETEKRENKRPLLSDLRDSGSIEQDADVVSFIFREEYYLERDRPVQRGDEPNHSFADRTAGWEDRMARVKGLAEVIVAKQRHGPIGDVTLMFDGAHTRFGNLAAHDNTDMGF